MILLPTHTCHLVRSTLCPGHHHHTSSIMNALQDLKAAAEEKERVSTLLSWLCCLMGISLVCRRAMLLCNRRLQWSNISLDAYYRVQIAFMHCYCLHDATLPRPKVFEDVADTRHVQRKALHCQFLVWCLLLYMLLLVVLEGNYWDQLPEWAAKQGDWEKVPGGEGEGNAYAPVHITDA